jgi:uncharacterized membrane protein
MSKGRLEAFSDGVIAIIITIMVLEIKMPTGHELTDLLPMIPIFSSYILSFINVGIYWNNHHHLFHLVEHVNGRILWANLHLLFWLSLLPIVTGWMGQNQGVTWPVVLYGADLLLCAIAFTILTSALIATHGRHSAIAKALGHDFKGKISLVFYVVALPLAFFNSWLAYGLYALVALIWFAPDPRIEKAS